MREPMRPVLNRLYPLPGESGDLQFIAMMDRAGGEALEWDEPELDAVFPVGHEARRRRERQ